jgi:hypothetical protein
MSHIGADGTLYLDNSFGLLQWFYDVGYIF